MEKWKASHCIRYSTWKGQCLYLEDFLVTERLRGQGAGKLLFDRLIEEAKEKGFKRMVWQVLDWNEPAINFYKKYNATLDPEWVNGSLDL
jgi:GNAT superfamily N-acetyltransferase